MSRWRNTGWTVRRVCRYAYWGAVGLMVAIIWWAMVVKTILCVVEELGR